MASLKGYTSVLARVLDMTPAALYERQRVLARAGMLDLSEGRGPGSGVRTTAGSVALLLVAVLASENLGDCDDRARAIGAAKPEGRQRCPLTHMLTFGDALAAILVKTGAAASVKEISISRTADRASFTYFDRDASLQVARFAGRRAKEPGVAIAATLAHNALVQISDDVTAIVLEEFETENDAAARRRSE